MKPRCLLTFIWIFLLAPSSAPAYAEVASELSGVVTDPSSEPVKDAVVTLLSLDRVYQAVESSNGKFHFENIDPGTYTMDIKAPGFLRKTFPLTFPQDGPPQDVKIVLEIGPLPDMEFCGRSVSVHYQALDSSGKSVSGFVRDFLGRSPISKARITFVHQSTAHSFVTVRSDKAGHFIASHLPPDYYDVRIYRWDCQMELLKHITVPRENNVLIDATLLKIGQLILCQ